MHGVVPLSWLELIPFCRSAGISLRGIAFIFFCSPRNHSPLPSCTCGEPEVPPQLVRDGLQRSARGACWGHGARKYSSAPHCMENEAKRLNKAVGFSVRGSSVPTGGLMGVMWWRRRLADRWQLPGWNRRHSRTLAGGPELGVWDPAMLLSVCVGACLALAHPPGKWGLRCLPSSKVTVSIS